MEDVSSPPPQPDESASQSSGVFSAAISCLNTTGEASARTTNTGEASFRAADERAAHGTQRRPPPGRRTSGRRTAGTPCPGLDPGDGRARGARQGRGGLVPGGGRAGIRQGGCRIGLLPGGGRAGGAPPEGCNRWANKTVATKCARNAAWSFSERARRVLPVQLQITAYLRLD